MTHSASTRQKVDVLISGGGIAGMITAAAFGAAGFQTLMIDPMPPVTVGDAASSDRRSTAFLRTSRELFKKIGIWDALEPFSTPLEGLRIVDTVLDEASQQPVVRTERQFEGSDIKGNTGENEPFGWNFLNWQMRRELMRILPDIALTEVKYGVGFKSMLTRTDHAIVSLTDGSRVEAKLVIGADGRNSAVRSAAGIGAKITRYGQKSLAFTAIHETPHNNVSTEIYREGGPFTMVPLADIDGSPASAIVWMNQGPRAAELLAMNDDDFNAAMTDRAASVYGAMKAASPRGSFAIITQTAKSLTAQRVALIAEAAHVLPPVGAQGLNTSLNDVTLLLDLAETAPHELGTKTQLSQYAKARHHDISARSKAVDMFNRVVRSENALVQSVRLLGLKAVHDIAPLRQQVMKAGLNPIS
jgi:2-octaprenyl-6-methoxyphenol hydroxylase